MTDHHRVDLAVDALDMAAALGRPKPGCLIHSDRGSECASRQLRNEMSKLEHPQSSGGPGAASKTPPRRASAVLKGEIGTGCWPDRTTARADTYDFVETCCNRRRLRKHIHWDYLMPYETRLRTGKIRPSWRNNTVFTIMGNLHLQPPGLRDSPQRTNNEAQVQLHPAGDWSTWLVICSIVRGVLPVVDPARRFSDDPTAVEACHVHRGSGDHRCRSFR
ncbi:hypothetical protein ABZY44_27505 [Streptomyces sp. NPDC006544]|uniref:hypothetical protein n=1 Tax=Streptomyces sp. NPDC006544 TaxID=3154583 RepID=UPI0033AA0E28